MLGNLPLLPFRLDEGPLHGERDSPIYLTGVNCSGIGGMVVRAIGDAAVDLGGAGVAIGGTGVAVGTGLGILGAATGNIPAAAVGALIAAPSAVLASGSALLQGGGAIVSFAGGTSSRTIVRNSRAESDHSGSYPVAVK